MQGYDREKALKAILKDIDRSNFSSLSQAEVEKYTALCMEADFAYMEKAGLLDENSDGFYDDDDAYDFIVEAILEKEKVSEAKELVIAELVDAYMEVQEQYMQLQGLLSWE